MNWFRQLFARQRMYSDLEQEIHQLLTEKVEALMAQGLSRKDAEQAAKREFGNRTTIEESGREVWMWVRVERLLSDVMFALRKLRRTGVRAHRDSHPRSWYRRKCCSVQRIERSHSPAARCTTAE